MLKLKKLTNEETWRGKVSYQDFEAELSDPSEVEREINRGMYHLFGCLVSHVKWVGVKIL